MCIRDRQRSELFNDVFVAIDSFCIDAFAISFLSIYFWRGSMGMMYVTLLFYTNRGLSLVLGGQWPKLSPYYFHYPGFPSLFVPYDPTNDLYFSGHVGLTTCLTFLCFDIGYRRLGYFGICVAIYTLIMLLSTGAHYTNDFIIGFSVATVVCKFIFFHKYGYTLFVLKAICYACAGVGSVFGCGRRDVSSFRHEALEECLNEP